MTAVAEYRTLHHLKYGPYTNLVIRRIWIRRISVSTVLANLKYRVQSGQPSSCS